jgi:tetratricopeptide (TPR) repeat protein
VENFEIQNGQFIADVGAASGWIEGIFSVFTDSVTYYVQDINENYSNEQELKQVVKHYSKVRETPQTNSFHLVIGTKTKTLLPDSTFDKVILNNTFHEIHFKQKILDDICHKLKPGGKIIICEGFSSPYKNNLLKGCGVLGLTVDTVIYYLKRCNFYLTNMTEPPNSLYNQLTFERNKSHSDDFFERRKTVETYINQLGLLDKKTIALDSSKTDSIGNYIKENLSEIKNVYKSVEAYINELGYWHYANGQYKEALNILSINLKLYPSSETMYAYFGNIYTQTRQYETALYNYSKCLEIDPDDIVAKSNIEKVKKLMAKM